VAEIFFLTNFVIFDQKNWEHLAKKNSSANSTDFSNFGEKNYQFFNLISPSEGEKKTLV
jgi:hypothetical protein